MVPGEQKLKRRMALVVVTSIQSRTQPGLSMEGRGHGALPTAPRQRSLPQQGLRVETTQCCQWPLTASTKMENAHILGPSHSNSEN